jgi:uncharacterized protein
LASEQVSSPIWRRCVQATIAWRWGLFLAAVLAGVLMLPLSRQLEYDRSIENMFSTGDPRLAAYRQFQRTFGQDDLVLLVYEDAGLWGEDGGGLARVEQVTQQVRQVSGVRDVFSLSVLNRLLAPLRTSIDDPEHRMAEAFREMFVGYTHGHDRQVASIVCLLEPMTMADPEMQRTIAELREVARSLPGGLAPGVLVGEAVMVSDSFRYVEEDAERLGWISSLLLGLTIIVCLRSLRWVAIALLVVQWTVIMTQGMLSLSGLRLSMVSSMLTAVVTVIAVATVLHIAIHFRDNCARGIRPRVALQHALSLLALPIFWACMTDAVGFLSLLVADVGPVRDFGWMMALGALLVFPAAFLLVPCAALFGRASRGHPSSLGERRLEAGLARLAAAVMHRPRWVALGLGAVLIVAVTGAARLRIETDFTRNFRRGSPIAEAYDFVERRLGGAGVWDVMVPAPAVLTEEYLSRIRALQQQLRELPSPHVDGEPALTKVLSLVDALDAAKFQPGLEMMPAELRARGMQVMMPDFFNSLRGQDRETGQHYLRIMLRSHDRREATGKQAVITDVTRLVQEQGPLPNSSGESAGSVPGPAEPRVTGYFVLLTHLVMNVLRDQWICFSLTIIGVGLMIAAAMRSVLLSLAALISNAFPIIVLLGMLGWWGVKLNMGAAMIAAVSMGLSVDGSIHYLYAFRRARWAGESTEAALQQAQQTVGRAMVFATLALVVGFLALCVSQFVPTIYFGVLGSLSLAGGLLGNLVVLPLLLKLWSR